jgi:hypothetical protein
MYPPAELASGFYTANDLPNAVTINGSSLSRVGTGYGNTTNGVRLESNEWARYIGGVRVAQPALISNKVIDQFANSYTITYPPTPISVVVTRVSLCVWQGNDGCGRPWYLIYGDSIFGIGNDYTWFIFMAIDENTICGDFQQPGASKIGFQNTPVGNYSGNNYGTVS